MQEIPEDEKIRREFNRDLSQYPTQSMTILCMRIPPRSKSINIHYKAKGADLIRQSCWSGFGLGQLWLEEPGGFINCHA